MDAYKYIVFTISLYPRPLKYLSLAQTFCLASALKSPKLILVIYVIWKNKRRSPITFKRVATDILPYLINGEVIKHPENKRVDVNNRVGSKYVVNRKIYCRNILYIFFIQKLHRNQTSNCLLE